MGLGEAGHGLGREARARDGGGWSPHHELSIYPLIDSRPGLKYDCQYMASENTPEEKSPPKRARGVGRSRPLTRQQNKRLSPSQQQLLLEMLLTKFKAANGGPGHGMSDPQIAARLGIGFRTVGRYKALFIKRSPELAAAIRGTQLDSIQNLCNLVSSQKVDVDQNWDPTPPPAPEPPPPPKEPRAKKEAPDHGLSVIRSEGTLPVEEMLRVLSEMATAGPPQYRVQAVKLLDELQAIHRPVESFGPPPPLTEEDRISRLAVLMEVCGRETTDAAYARTWGKNVEPTLESQEATEPHAEAPAG